MATKEQIEQVAKRLFDKDRRDDAWDFAEQRIDKMQPILEKMWMKSHHAIRNAFIDEAKALLEGIEITRDVERTIYKPVIVNPYAMPPADKPFREWLKEQGWPNTVMPIAMNSTRDIGPGESDFVIDRPDLVCRPYMFIVDPVCAPHFELTDMGIGNRLSVMGQHGIACTIFAAPKTFPEVNGKSVQEKPIFLDVPTCSPGENLKLRVKNIGSQRLTFRSCFLTLVKYPEDELNGWKDRFPGEELVGAGSAATSLRRKLGLPG